MNSKFYSFCFFLFTLFISVGSQNAFSQKMQSSNTSNLVSINENSDKSVTTVNNSVKEAKELLNEVKGTFQLEILKIDAEPVSITSELLKKIDELRKDSETAYLQIDEIRRIKIFSNQDLSSGKNKNIDEFVLVNSFKKE